MKPLDTYSSKRNFSKTPEPKGTAKNASTPPLHFVVQKHEASRLHYDFRIEVDGLLKSWALPKGPTMDPTQKHLAVMVEDHPFDYKDFEGTIPDGNYGAGTVMIWDEGCYEPIGAFGGKDISTAFKEGVEKGHLVFNLFGSKLKGEFALIRLARAGKNDWLFIKARDWYSNDKDILSANRSVRTGRSMEEIKLGLPTVPHIDASLKRTRLPARIKPMMAQLVDKPFNNKEWLFEIKWDGYRTVADIRHGEVNLYSRNGNSFNERFPIIRDDFKSVDKESIFDGEIVVVDDRGRSNFQLLQEYLITGKGNLIYYVFDLPYYDNYDLTSLPLTQRREILKTILPKTKNVRFSEDYIENGVQFFNAAIKQDLEGIMAKKKSSPYEIGKRGRDWLKIKNHMQQEAIICGYTKPKNTRLGFRALVLGVYDKDRLVHIGNVGTGFDEKLLSALLKEMLPLTQEKQTVDDYLGPTKDVTWVKPKLVCEVRFQEWTKDGRMRQPVFLGIRTDKKPKEVFKENPSAVAAENTNETPRSTASKISNLSKVFWPKQKITKGDLINYYEQVSDYILPHLKDRPQSLNRFPNGINGDHFFQKNVEKPPDWIDIFRDNSNMDVRVVNYLVCNGKRALEYIINLGCIDLNVWNSRTTNPNQPDFIVFDLDPVEIDFSYVRETALTIKDLLAENNIINFPKTSGKRGIHIYIPLKKLYSYEQVRDFAHLIAMQVHSKLIKTTSLERLPAKRKGKVYIDYLQNRRGATMAAPYSVRPTENATVSTPVTWGEIEHGIQPEDFTIDNTLQRLTEIGDIFMPVLRDGISIEAILKKWQVK